MNRHQIAKITVLTLGVGILALTAWSIYPLSRPVTTLPSTKVLDRNRGLLYEVTRPEGGIRTTVTLDKMPTSLQQATIAAEDSRFYQHRGVDWQATARAIWQLITQKRVVSGASTIEQQTVKTLYFPTAKRTPLQKIREVMAAQYWCLTHSKQQTLEIYLNTVALGNNSYGVASAAKTYFHKEIGDLTVAESAMLAGMLTSPSESEPFRHWTKAKARQTYVLDRMVQTGFIDQNQKQDSVGEDIQIFSPRHPMKAPHFVLYVLDQLEKKYPDIREGGYTITTTLDPELQRVATETVARRLAGLADQNVTNAAVMAMEPHTGEVLAYVGSNGYFDENIQGQVDMVQAKRQPGSSLKPFLYFLAFQKGMSPSTVVADLPVRYETADGKPYYPRNYSYKYYGPVSIREALGSSLNIPAVKVLDRVGLASFFSTLDRFGVDFPNQPEFYGLGVVLGGGETTLADVTGAYAKLALGAKDTRQNTVLDIRDAHGQTVWRLEQQAHVSLFTDQKLSDQASYLVTDVLTDKNARAKSFGEANLLDMGQPVAVKTGTTRDFHDNWAFGYTPDFVLGVWVGNANGSPMHGVSGITGAVPIWHDIMQNQISGGKKVVWQKPDGLVMRTVCATSGLLDSDICPKTKQEVFIAGQEPTQKDDWYVEMDIDGKTGLLATAKCRENVIKKTFLNLPAEYAAWSTAFRAERPPDLDCEGKPAANTKTEVGVALKILSPLEGDAHELDSMIDGRNQRIPFTAGGKADAEFVWELNGQMIRSQDPIYFWNPQPGTYTLKLKGSDSEVEFSVK